MGLVLYEWRNKIINKLLKSVLDQNRSPVVVCDIDHIIVYMNPTAISRYHNDLTGRSIKDCHPEKANIKADDERNIPILTMGQS